MQPLKTPLGNNSTKHPGYGMTWKRAMKLERIARLVADPAGYTNEQIANMLNCDKQTIVYIKQTPAFHAKMLEVSTGITSDWDADLRQDAENSRAELRSMMPSALLVIRNAIMSNNPQMQRWAASEILDREGTHAKVSKSSVSVVTQPNMTVDASVASNIMALLASAPVTGPGAETVAATGGFTSTAQVAGEQQKTMADDAESALDSLDLDTTKPN